MTDPLLIHNLDRIATAMEGINESLHTIAEQFEAATPLASLTRRQALRRQLLDSGATDAAAELEAITAQQVASLRQVAHLFPDILGGTALADQPTGRTTGKKRKTTS